MMKTRLHKGGVSGKVTTNQNVNYCFIIIYNKKRRKLQITINTCTT